MGVRLPHAQLLRAFEQACSHHRPLARHGSWLCTTTACRVNGEPPQPRRPTELACCSTTAHQLGGLPLRKPGAAASFSTTAGQRKGPGKRYETVACFSTTAGQLKGPGKGYETAPEQRFCLVHPRSLHKSNLEEGLNLIKTATGQTCEPTLPPFSLGPELYNKGI